MLYWLSALTEEGVPPQFSTTCSTIGVSCPLSSASSLTSAATIPPQASSTPTCVLKFGLLRPSLSFIERESGSVVEAIRLGGLLPTCTSWRRSNRSNACFNFFCFPFSCAKAFLPSFPGALVQGLLSPKRLASRFSFSAHSRSKAAICSSRCACHDRIFASPRTEFLPASASTLLPSIATWDSFTSFASIRTLKASRKSLRSVLPCLPTKSAIVE